MKQTTLVPAYLTLTLLALSAGAQAALPSFAEIDTDADNQLSIEEAKTVLTSVYDDNGDGMFNVLEAIRAVPDLGEKLSNSADLNAPVDADVYAEIASIMDGAEQG